MAGDRSDEQKRRDDEEERRYWESIEDERMAEEERREAQKAQAIETMETWFHENFESPELEGYWDSEDQVFRFPYGGPFDAGDVLHETFSHEFDVTWIMEAAERITRDGTFEWAPTSNSDYYEHPEFEDEPPSAASSLATAELTKEILDRLARLEAMVAALPTSPASLGHNQPPIDIGLPPYTDEDAKELNATIAETRVVLEAPAPDAVEVKRLSKRFEALCAKVAPWLGRKADLAVDKAIENTISAFTWAQAFGALGGIIELLNSLAHSLLRG